MKRLKAGSLQLVSFVVVIIAMLLMMLLLLLHTQKLFQAQSQQQQEALHQSQQYFHKTLTRKDFLSKAFLEESEPFQLQFETDPWGSFYLSKTKASWRSQIIDRPALTGMLLNDGDSVALYLKDNNRPLALVGQTYIEGQVYLPQRGVKSGVHCWLLLCTATVYLWRPGTHPKLSRYPSST